MKKTKRFFSLILIALICFSPCFFSPLTSAKAQTVADINANLSVSGWVDEKELTDTYLKVGEGVIPTGVNYHATFGDHEYLKEYILINGKSVKEINEDSTLGASEWNYTVFPATADVKYKIPVVLFASGDYVQIKMHDNYVALLGDKVEITAKAGLYFVNNGVRYENSADKTFTAWEKPVVTDFTQNLSTSGWIDQSELKVTYLCVGTGVMPSGIDYGMLDRAEYKYVQEYILINGKSVKEINEDQTLGAKDWTYTVFPSSKDDKYKVPIILFAQADRIEIKIHPEYLALLGDRVEITAKVGLYFENNGVRYENSTDKTFTVWEQEQIDIVDTTENVWVKTWSTTGDAGELTYARINLGDGVFPSGVEYKVSDGEWQYIQEYVLINGTSVKDINANTDVSSYVFSTFPSSVDDKYKLPIIIFVNNGVMELKIHNSFLLALGDDLEITIKSGLFVLNGKVKYTVEKDVCYVLSGDIWSDKNKLYTITYYVNGKEYAKDEVSYNSALNLCDEPQVESGYFFSGWEYSSTPSVIQDMEIHGYIRPVRYSITYHLNGGKNSPQNPIVYYVTDGEIILKDAVKEGAVFKGWYTSNDYAQRVEKLTTDKLGSVELYALFEEEPSSGCASSILGGDVAVVLMGVAITLIGIKGFKKAQSKKEPLPKNIR